MQIQMIIIILMKTRIIPGHIRSEIFLYMMKMVMKSNILLMNFMCHMITKKKLVDR